MAGLAAHGCGPNGSTTSLVLACRMLRAVQNPCRHIIVLPSTGLPPPWQFVCAESNTRIQSLTSRCAQLSPRWVCCVSNIISYAQRATVRIHLHNQISCSLDGSVTSLACRMRRAIHLWHAIRAELFIPMLTRARHGGSHAALAGSLTSLACRARRAIHSNAHSCAARWLSCSPRWVCHVSGMSYAQSYSFQCSPVLGTVALVQPSTGLSRLWHVVCAELFIPMLTRARHGGSRAALDGSVTSLACRMRRAIHSNAHSCSARWLSCSPRRVRHVSGMSYAQSYSFQCSLVHGTVAPVQPSTGLSRLWHVVCAELFIPMLTRARHGGSRAALDGSVTSLACRMRRAIHSNAHSCTARWLPCSPRRVCHVSGMSYAQSYSFQCSLVLGTVAPVQPSTGLSRLWHVVCAELFIPMLTRARHGGSHAALDGSVTSLACRMRRAIHSNAHSCTARWLGVPGYIPSSAPPWHRQGGKRRTGPHPNATLSALDDRQRRGAVIAGAPHSVAALLGAFASPAGRGLMAAHTIHCRIVAHRADVLKVEEHRPKQSWALAYAIRIDLNCRDRDVACRGHACHHACGRQGGGAI